MKKGFPYFPRPASFAIDGNYCTCDRRNFFVFAIDGTFLIFAINGILEFRDRRNFCIRDRRNFVIFAIDGICYVRDRRNFYFSRSTNQAIESSDRIKRSNQAIESSESSESIEFWDREFSRNWNAGIPEKREKRGKKEQWALLKPCMGTPCREALKREKKSQHITVPSVPVDMGTLLQLAWVSMLPCCAHVEKRPEVCIFDAKMAWAVLSAISSHKPL